MALSREEVRRIAELARLDIADDKVDRMARELSSVLDFVGALNRLDLGGLDASAFAPAAAPLREDEPDPRRLTTEQALAAAPESEHGFFIVPPIIENVNP